MRMYIHFKLAVVGLVSQRDSSCNRKDSDGSLGGVKKEKGANNAPYMTYVTSLTFVFS